MEEILKMDIPLLLTIGSAGLVGLILALLTKCHKKDMTKEEKEALYINILPFTIFFSCIAFGVGFIVGIIDSVKKY